MSRSSSILNDEEPKLDPLFLTSLSEIVSMNREQTIVHIGQYVVGSEFTQFLRESPNDRIVKISHQHLTFELTVADPPVCNQIKVLIIDLRSWARQVHVISYDEFI